MAVLRRVSDETPTPVRTINPAIPEWLATLIDRLLAKNPADRFASAAEVADLLQRYLDHLKSASPVPAIVGIPQGSTPKEKRLRARAVVLMLVTLAMLGLVIALFVRGSPWFQAMSGREFDWYFAARIGSILLFLGSAFALFLQRRSAEAAAAPAQLHTSDTEATNGDFLRTQCASCQTTFKVRPDFSGASVKCPACGKSNLRP